MSANNKFSFEKCVDMLSEKQRFLNSRGIIRYPQKNDFSEEEIAAIKAFLGPWPRALEKAGLKPADEIKSAQRLEKRIVAKRNNTMNKIFEKSRGK